MARLSKRRVLRNGTVIEILPWGSRVTLSTGHVVDGVPHDSESYRETARRLGYGADTLAMCQHHDAFHAHLCGWLDLGDSRSLRVAAGLEAASEVSEAEEQAVMSIQRFARLAGFKLTIE